MNVYTFSNFNSSLKLRLNKENKDKWCDEGVWKFSRHPNYFGENFSISICNGILTGTSGELLFWWGIFTSCSQSFAGVHNAGYFTLAGPIFIMGLLFGFSGIPILELNANKRFRLNPDYLHYRTDTSVLVPLPNAVYRRLPLIVKR